MTGLTLRRRAGGAAAAIALTAVSGCSLAFVEGPPKDHASRHFFDCTSSLLAPGLDATMAGIMALGTVGALSDGSNDKSQVVDGTVLAAAALASATYGYIRVSRCRDAKDALSERLLDMPYLGVPPTGMPGAPQPLAGAAGSAPATATGAPASAAPQRDPWLSEGPPPPPAYPRQAPTLMPPPPPYLRLAPPDPLPATPPPAAIAPPAPAPNPVPAPAREIPAAPDAGSQP